MLNQEKLGQIIGVSLQDLISLANLVAQGFSSQEKRQEARKLTKAFLQTPPLDLESRDRAIRDAAEAAAKNLYEGQLEELKASNVRLTEANTSLTEDNTRLTETNTTLGDELTKTQREADNFATQLGEVRRELIAAQQQLDQRPTPEAIATEKTQIAAEKAQFEQETAARIRAEFSKQFVEEKKQDLDELEKAHQAATKQALDQLKKDHDQKIAGLSQKHREELEQIRQNGVLEDLNRAHQAKIAELGEIIAGYQSVVSNALPPSGSSAGDPSTPDPTPIPDPTPSSWGEKFDAGFDAVWGGIFGRKNGQK